MKRKKRFIIKWIKEDSLFIGLGLIISKDGIGLTVLNLFIGFADLYYF